MKEAQDFIDEVANKDLERAYKKTSDTTLKKYGEMGIELYV